jgi:large subunit ribosomal protein L28
MAFSQHAPLNYAASLPNINLWNGALTLPSQVSHGTQYQQCRYRSKRSQRGLYDGKDVCRGNSLSFSMKSTKRTFKPNVFVKRVYSEILDEMIRFHVTTSALRSIDKMGGLDNYLLSSPHVTSGEGLQVKKRIINRLKYTERHGGELNAKDADDTAAAKG